MSGAVRRHFVAMFLTWGMISLAGFSSASNTPGKPTDLHVSSVLDLKIILKWKKPLTTAGTPDNSSLSYILSYKAASSNAHDLKTVTKEIAQLDLSFGKQYNIYVRAVRSRDHQIKGDWSDALRVDTKDLVPAKPINLHRANVKRLEITFSWEKPQTTVKGIKDASPLGYYVSYKNLENNARRQVRSSREQKSLRLSANAGYEIQVKAYKVFNDTVAGPWSDSLKFKTNESAPSKAPTNVKVVSSSPSSIKVTWGQIPPDGRNGIIQGYVVFYREEGISQWSKRKVQLVYTQELTGLTTKKLLSVRVAGYTKIGLGPKSVVKTIIVGGQFISTTTKIATQKPTTLRSMSTSMVQTIKTTSKSTNTPTVSKTRPTTVPEKPHRTLTPSRTEAVQVRTFTTASSDGLRTITDVSSTDPYTRTSTFPSGETAITPSVSAMHSSRGNQFDQTTPAVAAMVEADGGSKESFMNKILIIGASAAGGLLLIILLIFLFVLTIRRSRRRKQLLQNDEIPLEIIKPKRKRKRSKDVVTRGAYSVTYEPPSGPSTLNGDSMTVGLLQSADEPDQPDQPVIDVQQPNGTLPRAEADDAPLLATGHSDKYDHLRVDLSTGQSKLEEGRASGLYESIGSLGKAGCSDAAKADGKSDDDERYVTQEQVNATRDKAQVQTAPGEVHYKTPKAEPHYKRPKAKVAKDAPNGNMYENLPDVDRLYEILDMSHPEDPLYENTRATSSNQENVDGDGEYEPIPI